MRKAFADPDCPKGFHKLMGDDPNPLDGEELETAIKELPGDKEVVPCIKNSPAQILFRRDAMERNGKVVPFDSPIDGLKVMT